MIQRIATDNSLVRRGVWQNLTFGELCHRRKSNARVSCDGLSSVGIMVIAIQKVKEVTVGHISANKEKSAKLNNIRTRGRAGSLYNIPFWLAESFEKFSA